MTTLAPLPADQHDCVRHLRVRPGQLDFVAEIEQMLGEPTPGVEFHAILDGDGAVGFFKIDPPGVSTFDFVPDDAISMRGLLVGAQYQGRGFGRAAMAALPAYLAARYDAPRAVLAVDAANPVALRTYLSGGWSDSGDMHETRSGQAHVLTLDLDMHRG